MESIIPLLLNRRLSADKFKFINQFYTILV